MYVFRRQRAWVTTATTFKNSAVDRVVGAEILCVRTEEPRSMNGSPVGSSLSRRAGEDLKLVSTWIHQYESGGSVADILAPHNLALTAVTASPQTLSEPCLPSTITHYL
jgi:hypothetical protein